MQANPDNGWIQIESMRLVGFEFKARSPTIGWIKNSRRVPGNNLGKNGKKWREIISLSFPVPVRVNSFR
jgi:hypothetical protein